MNTLVQTPPSEPNSGDLFSGRVDYVGDKFAKVASGDLTAVVFLNEMADHFIKHPSEILHEGQSVDFVLINYDPKGWVASISAAALLGINKGDQVKGKICKLQDRGATLCSDSFQVWLPIAELDWRGIDHPSEVISLGDEVEAQIIHVELLEGGMSVTNTSRVQ